MHSKIRWGSEIHHGTEIVACVLLFIMMHRYYSTFKPRVAFYVTYTWSTRLKADHEFPCFPLRHILRPSICPSASFSFHFFLHMVTQGQGMKATSVPSERASLHSTVAA